MGRERGGERRGEEGRPHSFLFGDNEHSLPGHGEHVCLPHVQEEGHSEHMLICMRPSRPSEAGVEISGHAFDS